ncbi:MAG: hypothetical protein PUB85_07280, partial [Clostridia bacterium]|nr:hypothetical protein [Clostridia bacterium]
TGTCFFAPVPRIPSYRFFNFCVLHNIASAEFLFVDYIIIYICDFFHPYLSKKLNKTPEQKEEEYALKDAGS